VIGQDTQEQLDYKEKHFCEDDETIKALKGSDGSIVETKRCGVDKQGKASCVYCNKCANGFQREETNCNNGQETQEELDYKEKHFCESDETGKYLKGADGEGIVETKRCGFDKSGKPRCMYCNKCADGFKREGSTCTSGSAFMASGGSVPMIAVGVILFALLAGLLFVCKIKRESRSDNGGKKSIGQATMRNGTATSRRGGRSQRR